jgi:hypothetical protein
MVLAGNSLHRYVSMALQIVDFAIQKFPSRSEFEKFQRLRTARRNTA